MDLTEQPQQDVGRPAAPRQASWRFLHEGAGALAQMPVYAVRRRLLAALPQAPMLELSFVQRRLSIDVIARSPQASEWMLREMAAAMGVFADLAGRELVVEPELAAVDVQPGSRWLYSASRIVVERSGRNGPAHDWQPWRKTELATEQQEALQKILQEGIASDLARWGRQPVSAGGIRLLSAGRPMVISPAEGPRGIARLDVRFIAPWRLAGNVFVGKHTQQGHGLLYLRGEVTAAGSAARAESLQGDFA